MQQLKSLLSQAQSGNLTEYGVIVRRFQDMAVGYAYSILGDFHLAEDAAQEAFTEAYSRLGSVYGPEAFPSWLRRIVFKHCDRLTRRKRVVTAPLEAADRMAAGAGDTAAYAEAHELRDEVQQAITSLPTDARSAITLFYISDYSQREIGEFLGVPVTTVKNRLRSARKHLRERMIDMVKENLRENRPSNDEGFAGRVLERGLRDVYIDRTETSFIGGGEGKLLYRGYNIQDLAERSTFEETAYLLLHGSLPTVAELRGFDTQLKANRSLPNEILRIIRDTRDANPLDVLRTAVSAMSSADSDGGDSSPEATMRRGMQLIASAPTVVAAHARIRAGKREVAPDGDLGHAANFLYMVAGKPPDSYDARLIDKDIVLHAEHGVNASSFAARVVASTGADLYAAITAALAALKGPQHGGAAEEVMKMAREIGSPQNAKVYVSDLLKGGGRVKGFGHAVYRATDPRAVCLRADAEALAKRKGQTKRLSILQAVSEAMQPNAKEGIHPTVDLWASVIYHLVGIPDDLFGSMFAIGRIPGWTMHAMEQYRNNILLRPRLEYTGSRDLAYVPIEQREPMRSK